jgi:hypothetical protein
MASARADRWCANAPLTACAAAATTLAGAAVNEAASNAENVGDAIRDSASKTGDRLSDAADSIKDKVRGVAVAFLRRLLSAVRQAYGVCISEGCCMRTPAHGTLQVQSGRQGGGSSACWHHCCCTRPSRCPPAPPPAPHAARPPLTLHASPLPTPQVSGAVSGAGDSVKDAVSGAGDNVKEAAGNTKAADKFTRGAGAKVQSDIGNAKGAAGNLKKSAVTKVGERAGGWTGGLGQVVGWGGELRRSQGWVPAATTHPLSIAHPQHRPSPIDHPCR